jgi:hypothetical protein
MAGAGIGGGVSAFMNANLEQQNRKIHAKTAQTVEKDRAT